ncbi:hypothetical protein [Microbulbifer taiwanensis]|uniref:hypothetical protein n=1 Tax=Microbulbifer taiwanensis TaxID=986746 RepID=UPI00362324DA
MAISNQRNGSSGRLIATARPPKRLRAASIGQRLRRPVPIRKSGRGSSRSCGGSPNSSSRMEVEQGISKQSRLPGKLLRRPATSAALCFSWARLPSRKRQTVNCKEIASNYREGPEA